MFRRKEDIYWLIYDFDHGLRKINVRNLREKKRE